MMKHVIMVLTGVNEKIAYLKVQFIYQSGRNTAVKAFIEVAQTCWVSRYD